MNNIGYFCGCKFFMETPCRPSEDIFTVLIFVLSIDLSSSTWLTFLQLVTTPMLFIFEETNLSTKSVKISHYRVLLCMYTVLVLKCMSITRACIRKWEIHNVMYMYVLKGVHVCWSTPHNPTCTV